MVSRARSRCLIALSSFALAASAQAQTYHAWSGLGTNGQWTSGANWQGAVAPANDGSASVQFGTSNRTVVIVDTAQDILGLKFDYPAANDLRYLFNGGATTLTLGSGGLVTTNAAPAGSPPALGSVNSSTPGTATFQSALGIVLSANQTWSLAPGTAVLANGNVTGPGSLRLSGNGHVSLRGNNTYAGGTDLAGGTLALGSNTALGSGPLTVSGPAAIFSDASSRTLVNALLLNTASLLIEAYSGEVRFTGPVTLGANTALTNNGALTILDGAVGEAGGSRSLTLSGVGVGGLVLAGNSTYTGGTTLYSGRLVLDHPAALGTGALTVQRNPYSALPRVETSLTTAPTFGNALVVQSGFEVGGPNAFTWSGNVADSGAGTGTIWKHGVSTLTVSGHNSAFSGGFHVGEGTITFARDTAAGTGEIDFGSTGTITAAFTTPSPTIGGLGAGSPGARVSLGSSTYLTVNQTSGSTFLGQIQGAGGIIKTGPASLTLNAAGSYTGGSRIAAGTLGAGATGALGTGPVVLDGPTSELNVASGAVVANPVVFGPSGGLLSGRGSFSSGVTVGANSGIAPGRSVATLSFAAGLNLASGGRYEVEVQNATGGAGTGWDTTVVTGTLNFTATLGSPFTIFLRSIDGSGAAGSAVNFDPYTAYSWTILSATTLSGYNGSAVLLDTSGFLSPVNGGTFSLAASSNALAVNFTPVPEPETWALLVIGLGAAAWTQLRRRRG